jgi:hypothetical protein
VSELTVSLIDQAIQNPRSLTEITSQAEYAGSIPVIGTVIGSTLITADLITADAARKSSTHSLAVMSVPHRDSNSP